MNKATPSKIQFVWNADFSMGGGVRALKEVVSGRHSCSLCGIAYHRIRQTAEWKAYKRELEERLGVEIREPCRNQLKLAEQRAAADDFPTVLAHSSQGIVKLLSGGDIDGCDGDFATFRRLLDAALTKPSRSAAKSHQKPRASARRPTNKRK